MRKLEKKDKYNLLIIIASFFVFLLVIFFNGNGIYGSHMDFSSQHYLIPEYFRTLFYNTKDLFPSYAFNLGDGQNIYNFSYYGLLSPIILISYLFPFIKMIYYLNIVSIILVITSIILFYKFISGYTDNKNIRLISGLLFLLAMPILFHTHRHIMFICYIPFLLMALFGTEKYVKDNKKILLIISTFLIIMTSYFYAVPSIIVIIIYAIYLYIKDNNIKVKELFLKTFKLGLTLLIPVLMSMVLILPSFSAILNSRFEEKGIEIFKMFIPDFSFNNVLYNQYSLGLTSIFIAAISYFIISKNKENKFLAYTFLLIIFFPIISYILNGLMYVNGKVFIPFIPLGIILITELLNNIKDKKVNLKYLLLVFLIISILGCINFNFDRILKYTLIYYLIDLILVVLSLILSSKRNFKYVYLLILMPISLCIIVNISDILESKSLIDNQYDKNIKNEVISLNNNPSIYRTIDETNRFGNFNNIRDISEYKNTMYSSLTNKNYKQFNWYLFEKENPFRNDAIYSDNSNILYNIYTGSKYYIGNNKIIGYKKVGNKTYQNDDVFSIGYVNHNYMSEKEFDSLSYPYNLEALMNYTIINKDISSNYKTNLKEINLKKTSYVLNNDEEKTYNYKLNKTLKSKILIIKFDMDYNETCQVGDTYIKINNNTNLLTCKGWKYHNKNNTFEYVISEENLKELNITFSKGKFEINNIKAYLLDYNYIKDINITHDNLIINKEKTKGDIIEGSINTTGGLLNLTIPYDKGYSIYIDNKKEKVLKINKHLLGTNIKEGTHSVKIVYKSPLLNYGKVLSLLGILLFVIVIVIDKKRSR